MSAKGRKLRNFVEANFSGGVGAGLWMNTFRKDDSAASGGSKSRLTSEQRSLFEEQGFLVVPGLVPAALVAEASRLDIALEQRQKAPDRTRLEESMRDLLAQYRRASQVLDWVEHFCGAKILSLAAMYVSVPPNSSGAALHQNGNFLPLSAEDEGRVVSVWTLLDRGGPGLVAMPGSHRGSDLQHSVEDGVIIDPMFEDEGAVTVEAQPGDAVFIHPRLVHGTAPNRSSVHRKEMISHYAPSNLRYIEKPSASQDYWKDSAYVVRSADSRL
ncbi:phytanoyl-CoA dioxygenase, peroxisomal-like isoform X1 [Haemaphysalis longicornis]